MRDKECEMPGRTLLDALAENGALALRKVSGLTSNGTAGTRSAHAHGLRDHTGGALAPSIAIPVVTAADADGALAEATVRVVKMDGTNVTVRATAISVPFDLYVG